MTPNEDLQAAIAACRKASRPWSDRERAVLATLEASRDANNAWERLAFRPSPEKPIVHRKVVELILKSHTLAADPSAFNTLVERKMKQFAKHKSSVDDLINYFSGSLSDPLVPSVTSGSSDYKRLVSILEDMRSTLFLYRDFEVQDALEFPQRVARGKNAEARTFEHLLTTYIRKNFVKPFDDFARDISRALYPEVSHIEIRTLQKNREKDERRRENEMRKLRESDPTRW